ncbi:MAG: hypothetical protein HAW67_07685 [Endozoicomonadaceae bacterium]|nr:hypothetical protein [Endozoicomonadaceae bacterium]
MRIGSGHGCGATSVSAQWVIEEVRCLPKGSYELMRSVPEAIKQEKELRVKSNTSWKRWHKNVQGVGYWLVDVEDNDNSYIEEALSVGIKNYLTNYE